MLFWGVLLLLAALGLAAKSGWARWFTIIVVILSLLSQLSWLGNPSPPWSLVVITLEIVVFTRSRRAGKAVYTLEKRFKAMTARALRSTPDSPQA